MKEEKIESMLDIVVSPSAREIENVRRAILDLFIHVNSDISKVNNDKCIKILMKKDLEDKEEVYYIPLSLIISMAISSFSEYLRSTHGEERYLVEEMVSSIMWEESIKHRDVRKIANEYIEFMNSKNSYNTKELIGICTEMFTKSWSIKLRASVRCNDTSYELNDFENDREKADIDFGDISIKKIKNTEDMS